jgi:hypothetical protein
LVTSAGSIVTCFTSTGGVSICQTQSTGITTGATFDFFGIFFTVFAIGFVISIIWIALDYFLVYRNLGSAITIPNARTPALVLGIIQLIFGGLIPGILLIVAYLKIGDSVRDREVYQSQARWK